MIEGIIGGFAFGMMVGFLFREYILTRDILRQNELEREKIEMEQRIWKNISEKLNREKTK